MSAKFLIGAFAILIVLSLAIVAILRGVLNPIKIAPRPNSSQTPLPVVSASATASAAPSDATNQNNPSSLGIKSYSNPDMALSFNYPARFTLIATRKPPVASFPFLAYDFSFSLNGQAASGFGIFTAPHKEGESLTDILNEQNRLAQTSGQTPATYSVINNLGNSLQTAKFTAGSPSLYALRSRSFVYYVYPLSPDISSSSLLETVLSSIHLSEGGP